MSKLRNAIGMARREFLYPGYDLSRAGKRSDERSCHREAWTQVELSAAEKREISSLWRRVVPGNLSRGHIFYRMAKATSGFDARFLPSSYYFPHILYALSPVKQASMLDHKSLMPLLFPDIAQPEQICCTIGGGIFGADMRPIRATEAAEAVRHAGCDLIVKTACDTDRGLGVELVGAADALRLAEAIEDGSIFRNHPEFVIQKVAGQSEATALFNPTSLNCMRITTLLLNGRVSICSMGLKCGGKGAAVDNIGGGRGGVIVGINADGSLRSEGFLASGEKTLSHNGIEFAGKSIPDFGRVIEAAERLQSRYRDVRLIGWDIALLPDGQPMLVEANAIWPGITLEQLTSGPLFGDRTGEVIDFVSRNPAVKF